MDPAADLDRPPGLGVGRRAARRCAAATRLTPTENGRRPPPLSPATAVTARRTTSWPATGSSSPSATRQQGDHLGGEVDASAMPGATVVGDLPPGGGEPLLPLPPLRARTTGVRRRRVDLGGDHDDRAGAGPSRTSSACSATYAASAGPAQQQVAQEVALVLVLDGRDRLLAGDQQRGDRGRPLERVHVVGGDRLVGAQAHQAGQVDAAGGHPQERTSPSPTAVPRVDPLDPEPAGRVDQVVRRRSSARCSSPRRRGPLAAVGRGEQRPRRRAPGLTSAAMPSRLPPSSTIWVSPVCSASTRASAALAQLLAVTAYQHLRSLRRMRWHNLTSPNRNRPRLASVQVIPVSAPAASARPAAVARPTDRCRCVHRGPRRGRTSRSPAAASAWSARRATAVPCALRVATDRPRPRSRSRSAYVATACCTSTTRPLPVGRLVDVRRPRRLRDRPSPDRGPATAASATSAALVGRGDGLTPYGDDVLCGWLAVHRAAGVATPEVDAAVRALPATAPRCSPRRCSTARCTARCSRSSPPGSPRSAPPPSPTAPPPWPRVGHTSGRGLLHGARARPRPPAARRSRRMTTAPTSSCAPARTPTR